MLGNKFENDEYLYPIKVKNSLYMGGYRQQRIVHYHNKELIGELDERTFKSN